jgi:thymidylate synthase
MNKLIYKNANEAYEETLKLIKKNGVSFQKTLALFNHGFIIQNPMDNLITNEERKWNEKYAIAEFDWYESKDPSVIELSKRAKIWEKHMDSLGNVNSNYGAQLNRNNQLENIVNIIKEKKDSRQAWLTIYDAKDIKESPFTNNGFKKDTPCTLSIGFQHYNGKLNMTVLMRSNDIWFGFCNDQYCFSRIFKQVCDITDNEIGEYYHYSSNMHLYV